MNLELYIENLGAIEKAELSVNPLTILAGENGTGKSFVTKFLYSILNVFRYDSYTTSVLKNINILESNFYLLRNFSEEYGFIDEIDSFLIYLSELAVNIQTKSVIDLEKLVFFKDYYLKNVKKSEKKIYTDTIRNRKDKDINEFQHYIKLMYSFDENELILNELMASLKNPKNYIKYYLNNDIKDELKGNFQISELKQLIKTNKKRAIFQIKNFVKITISSKEMNIEISDVIRNLASKQIFFESSVYWRLLSLINDTSNSNYLPNVLPETIKNEKLTGVPKHFLDLKDLVFTNFKHGERPTFIEECADELQASLNGKFNSNGNDLAFETNQGQAISKNLVSFGMTNLGVLQAVLSKNIINKGSFVFIDEPESNLHPEWQAILAKILVKLAENGVYVVITTHSSDMLKALEVYTTHQQQESFISTNYFEKNGSLAVFSEDEIQNVGKLALVRNQLLEPYASLTFAKKGGFFDD